MGVNAAYMYSQVHVAACGCAAPRTMHGACARAHMRSGAAAACPSDFCMLQMAGRGALIACALLALPSLGGGSATRAAARAPEC